MLAFVSLSAVLALAPPALATEPVMGDLAAPASPDAIVGGELVEPGEYPAVISVTIASNLCTGTLLTPELVLTAAHCLDHSFLPPSLVQVGIGEDRRGRGARGLRRLRLRGPDAARSRRGRLRGDGRPSGGCVVVADGGARGCASTTT